jgi:tRNA (cmo5U34)-methyltransferase
MPFGTAIYDAALTVMAMHHFTDEDRRAIYGKIVEALRPGGRYVEADRVAQDDAAEAAFRADFLPGDAARCELPVTGEKIEALLREAGFSSVERRWRKDDRAIYVARKEPKK